jgi:hypothetical protein
LGVEDATAQETLKNLQDKLETANEKVKRWEAVAKRLYSLQVDKVL